MVNLDSTLDLDPADLDQIDLFYLVDCVLDEVEQVKLAAAGISEDSTDDDDTMPIASPHFYDTELMEHLETPLHGFVPSDQSFEAAHAYISPTPGQLVNSIITEDDVPQFQYDYFTYLRGNQYSSGDIRSPNSDLLDTSKVSSADSLYDLGGDQITDILDSVANTDAKCRVTQTASSYSRRQSGDLLPYSVSDRDDDETGDVRINTRPNTTVIMDDAIPTTIRPVSPNIQKHPVIYTVINKRMEESEPTQIIIPTSPVDDRLQTHDMARATTQSENIDVYSSPCDTVYALPSASYSYGDRSPTQYSGYGSRRVPDYGEFQQYRETTEVSVVPQERQPTKHHHLTIDQKASTVQYPQFYDEDSNDTVCTEFVSWATKHPEHWNPSEVLDWLYYTADRNNLDSSLLRGESFRGVTGSDMCKMSPEQFCMLEPHYGQFYFNMMRKLVNGSTPDSPYTSHTSSEAGYRFDTPVHADFRSDSATSPSRDQGPSATYSSPEYYHSYQHSTPYTYEQQSRTKPETAEPLTMPGYDYAMTSPDLKYEQPNTSGFYSHPYYVTAEHEHRRLQSGSAAKRPKIDSAMPRRRPGRPRIKSLPTEEELRLQREKRMRSQHLWEFIYETLTNPRYNPSVIKWENEKQGVFRFVQSEIVAQMWGTLKNNDQMTYEKLSRAMRHYYKRGILERVEGRRLVYKFTPPIMERMRVKAAVKVAQVTQGTQQPDTKPNTLLLQNTGFPGQPDSYAFFTNCITK